MTTTLPETDLRPALVTLGAAAPGADAAALPPEACDGEDAAAVLLWPAGRAVPANDDPARARLSGAVCLAEGGLAAARALDAAGARPVPRAVVRRAKARYGFVRSAPGEGFSTYQLDPGSFADWTVEGCGGLAEWLRAAQADGAEAVWLHAADAEEARRGFSIELLRKAAKVAPGLGVWLSGGGVAPRHFERLVSEPGLTAVLVPIGDLPAEGAEAARAALAVAPDAPAEAPPCIRG